MARHRRASPGSRARASQTHHSPGNDQIQRERQEIDVAPGLDTYVGIDLRIEILRFVEHVDANRVAAEVIAAAGECFIDDIRLK